MTKAVLGSEVPSAPRSSVRRGSLWGSVWSALQSVSMPNLRVVAERAFGGRSCLDAAGLSQAFASQGVCVDECLSALLVVADGAQEDGRYVLSLPQFKRAILANGAVLHGTVGARQLVLNRNSRFLIALGNLVGDRFMGIADLRQSFERLCLRPPRALLNLLIAVLGGQSAISMRDIEQAVADGLIDLHNDKALEGIVLSRLVARWLAREGDGSLVANQLVERLRSVQIEMKAHHAGLLQAAFGSRHMFGFALLAIGDVERAIEQGAVRLRIRDDGIELSLADSARTFLMALDNSPYFRDSVSDASRFARGISWLMTWSDAPLIPRDQANAFVAAYGVNGVIRIGQIKEAFCVGALEISSNAEGWILGVNVRSEDTLFRKLLERVSDQGYYTMAALVDALPRADAFILPAEADLLVRAYGIVDESGQAKISFEQVRLALSDGFVVSAAVNGRIQLTLSELAHA